MIENLLAESAHFKIIGEFEIVKLKRWGKRTTIIGDFYGDPSGALIDQQEKWCLMYGAGIIIYFLRPPFQEYSYH